MEGERQRRGGNKEPEEGRRISTEASLLSEEQRCINIGGYVRMRELDESE